MALLSKSWLGVTEKFLSNEVQMCTKKSKKREIDLSLEKKSYLRNLNWDRVSKHSCGITIVLQLH